MFEFLSPIFAEYLHKFIGILKVPKQNVSGNVSTRTRISYICMYVRIHIKQVFLYTNCTSRHLPTYLGRFPLSKCLRAGFAAILSRNSAAKGLTERRVQHLRPFFYGSRSSTSSGTLQQRQSFN